MAELLWKELPAPLPANISSWANATLAEDAWDQVSLIAHFMADLLIERNAKNLTDEELRQGFPEFGWWALRLKVLYSTFQNEQRLVKAMTEFASTLPQDEVDRRELESRPSLLKAS